MQVIIFTDFYQMDETDARATILDLSEFSEASHRFFDKVFLESQVFENH